MSTPAAPLARNVKRLSHVEVQTGISNQADSAPRMLGMICANYDGPSANRPRISPSDGLIDGLTRSEVTHAPSIQ